MTKKSPLSFHVDRKYSVNALIANDIKVSANAAEPLCRENFKDLVNFDLNIEVAYGIQVTFEIFLEKSYHAVLLDPELSINCEDNPVRRAV